MVGTTQQKRYRALWIVGAVVVAIALVAGTWFVAAHFQSPAQRQAAAEPPPIQPVVVEVVRGELVERTTVMSTAARDGERVVGLPVASGVSVVTDVGVAPNAKLGSGNVVLWVNDHPVFAVEGQFPLFRDVGEGDSGRDVLMVQQALAAMGYDVQPDGDFGAVTAAALKDLYVEVGVEAPTREVTEVSKEADKTPEKPKNEAPSVPVSPKVKKQVVVQMADFVVIKGLPCQAVSVPPVGTTLTTDNAKLLLSGQKMALTAKVPGSTAVRLTTALKGSVEVDGKAVPIKILSISPVKVEAVEGEEQPAESESAESVVAFSPVSGEFPSEWVGRKDVLVSLDLVEPIKDVLMVPARAIATDSAGKGNVLVQGDEGVFTQVSVVQKGCVGGMCAIGDVAGVSEGAKLRVDR